MSSLIYFVEEEQIFIATDTLATTFNGEPLLFTTKAFVLPHLSMVICGTGIGGFLGRWFNMINDGMVIKGIDDLNHHTPQILKTLWGNFNNYEISSLEFTTTVYHFGISENDEVMHAYAYRSANDFTSEIIGCGIGVKPECEIPEKLEFPVEIISIMDNQRYCQTLKSKNERVYIGGERIIHQITKNGIIIYSYGKFDDFHETEKLIYENSNKSNSIK